MDTAIFISSTNFIMFTIVYNYYYFVNISKRYTAFQLFLSATLSVILSAIIIYLELISTDDFFKSASFPFPYEGRNNSSTVSFSSLARRKASASVGSYLLFSIAFTVCRIYGLPGNPAFFCQFLLRQSQIFPPASDYIFHINRRTFFCKIKESGNKPLP